ncbi:MAG: hypothetical protein WAW17_11550 [Rhodococcus sp. (in: high G+C Gram-positive bacteria)]
MSEVAAAARQLTDADFVEVARRVSRDRPGLAFLASALEAGEAEGARHDVVYAEVVGEPTVPESDYTQSGVPTFDRVRDKIEGRFGTAVGAGELARESPAGHSVEEQWEAREKAAKAKLEEIRRSMGDE